MSKTFTKRLTILLAILIFVTFGLSGCGNDQPAVDQNENDEVEEQQGEEVQEEQFVVTDGLGRQIEISEDIERIVVTYGIAGHMVCALGAQDKIVGIDSPSKDNEFFNAIKPGYSSLPSPGNPGEVNIEEVIALKPDIILVPGRNEELVAQMEEHGLTVFGVVAEDLEQLKTTMENLGKIFGAEEEAARFIKYYDDTMEMVEEKTKDIGQEERPGIYLIGPMGLFSTCSEDMYQNDLIELAGGRNVAAGEEGESDSGRGWFELSPEQLINWNPDIMVVVQYTSGITPEEILKDDRLQEINAVKNKQVYWFPSELNPWDYPSPQAVLGIKWLAQKLHPDKFDFDMQNEADEFFEMLYNKTFTELGGTLD